LNSAESKASLQVDHINSLLFVTGLSGAGKSSAMALLADSGYYVVDNLPVPLLEQFFTFSRGALARYRNTALLLDIDSSESRMELLSVIEAKGRRPANLKVIFLDADDASIVRRYSETRRPHPSFDPEKDTTLADTIARERSRLQPIKEAADFSIDTSSFNIHALRRELRDFLSSLGAVGKQSMRVNFLSFGFKHGIPLDCDLILDVRFLRNPHFVEELRQQDGRDRAVHEYVFETPDAKEFVERYTELLTFLLPRYQAEGKAYLNIGIGCTGGKHRSVAIAEALAKKSDATNYLVSIKHRDVP
jgi:UPF0042 nucleotide-binding protein